MLSKKYFLPLIIVLGTLVRAYALFHYGDFWYDEMFSITYSQKSWADSWHFWVLETNPPLHMFLLKLWFAIVPTNEWVARLPSLLFGVLSIPLIYTLGRRLKDNTTGLLAALLLAITPMHVFYSVTTRAYSLYLFLILLSTLYFLKIFFWDDTKKLSVYIYGASLLLLLYTHLTCLSIIFTHGLLVLVFRREHLTRWLKILALPVALWLLWAVPSLLGKAHFAIFQKAWFFRSKPHFWDKTYSFELLTFGPLQNGLPGLLFTLGLVGFACTQLVENFTKNIAEKKANAIALLLLVIPVALPFSVGLYDFKFIMGALPGLLLTLAFAISLSPRKNIALGLVVLAYLAGVKNTYDLLPISAWQPVNAFVTDHYQPAKTQAFIFANFFDRAGVDRYLTPALAKIPYLPETTTLPWDDFVITHNYILYDVKPPEIQNWFTRENLQKYDEIFVLQQNKDAWSKIDLSAVVAKNGYEAIAGPIIMPLSDRPNLTLYRRKK